MRLGNIMQTSPDLVNRSRHFGKMGSLKPSGGFFWVLMALALSERKDLHDKQERRQYFWFREILKAKDSYKILEFPKAFKSY